MSYNQDKGHKKLWNKIRQRCRKNQDDDDDHSYMYSNSARRRSKSTSAFTRIRKRNHERMVKFHEKVKDRCKSITKRKRKDSESSVDDDFRGSPAPDKKSRKFLPRSSSMTNFVKRITPGKYKKKNLIIGGENDEFDNNNLHSPKDDYYPFSPMSNSGVAGNNSSNVWIYSVDSSSGQTVYKNVHDGTKSFVKPRGEDVVLLDYKLVEQTIERPRVAVKTVSLSQTSKQPETPVKSYPVDVELETFLSEIEMIEKKEVFYKENVDYNMLRSLTEVHLADIGLKLGERLKVLKAIRERFPEKADPVQDMNESEDVRSISSYSSAEEEAVYSVYRGRSRSTPISAYLKNRGLSPAALTELDGVEVGSSTATIVALTKFVDKILTIKDSRLVKEDIPVLLDTSSMVDYESDYDVDRQRQKAIRQDEKVRKDKLLEVMRERNIKPSQLVSETVLLFDLDESEYEKEVVSFDLEDDETTEIFVLSDAVYENNEFSFLNEEENKFDFLNDDSGSDMDAFDVAIENDNDLEDQLHLLQAEIKTTETVLEANGVRLNHIETEVNLVDGDEPVHKNSVSSDTEKSSSDEEGPRVRSKGFLKRLQDLATDPGFKRIIENEAATRDIDLQKLSERSTKHKKLEEQASKVENYLLIGLL